MRCRQVIERIETIYLFSVNRIWKRLILPINQVMPQRGELCVAKADILDDPGLAERRAAEEAQRFLAAIVECSEDAIAAFTPSGHLLTWNRGAEVIFGYSAGEAIGMNVSVLAERPAGLANFIEQVLQGQTVSQYEGLCRRKDGAEISRIGYGIAHTRRGRGGGRHFGHPPRYLGASGSGANAGISGVDRGIFGRCDSGRKPGWDDPELEPGRRSALRVHERGDHRKAREHPGSTGVAGPRPQVLRDDPKRTMRQLLSTRYAERKTAARSMSRSRFLRSTMRREKWWELRSSLATPASGCGPSGSFGRAKSDSAASSNMHRAACAWARWTDA